MKSIIASVLLVVVCASVATAAATKPVKRQAVYYTAAVAPAVVAAAPVVASVPVTKTASVVHEHPTQVVRTEQVRTGDSASYSYSSELKSNPHVHTTHVTGHVPAVVASAPVVAAAPVVASAVHHVPSYYGYGYGYPYAHSYASYAYSPYSYVVGK